MSTAEGSAAPPAGDRIEAEIARMLIKPVPPAVTAIAAAARARHGAGIAAVLFYGSCLRDGEDRGRLVDLYLLADSYAAVHEGRLARITNRLIPPNVYYLQIPFEDRTVRAKYALVSLDQFARLTARTTDNPYFWARFAQPVAIAWARDEGVTGHVRAACATAVRTLLAETAMLADPQAEAMPAPLFANAFALTYKSELRAEPPGRAALLVRHDADHYRKLEAAWRDEGARPVANAARARRAWRRRQILGKLWSVARLVKAAFTFSGGADYLAWKIERHSGTRVTLTDWQRRHPILASPAILWRLWRQGAIR